MVIQTLEKCMDCEENERVYGPNTEYQIGEYAHYKNGLCTVHHLIHLDVGHYDEDYCDFCEEEVE